jgi:hypothetical protein
MIAYIVDKLYALCCKQAQADGVIAALTIRVKHSQHCKVHVSSMFYAAVSKVPPQSHSYRNAICC